MSFPYPYRSGVSEVIGVLLLLVALPRLVRTARSASCRHREN
jgi:hypothetical protein